MAVLTLFKPGSAGPNSLASALVSGSVSVHTPGEWEVTVASTHQKIDWLSAANDITYLGPSAPVPTGGTVSSIVMKDGPGYTTHWSLAGLTFDIDAAIGYVIMNPTVPAVTSYLVNALFGGNDTVIGSAGRDVLKGYAGNDRITGRGGNDHETGGAGDDTFVFRAGFGKDVISDFSAGPAAGDVLDVHGLFANLTQVKNHSHVDAAGHLVIAFDANDTITLNTVHGKASLAVNDFHF